VTAIAAALVTVLSDFWRTARRRNSFALSDGMFLRSLSARNENSGFVVSTRAGLALGVLSAR